MLLAGLDFETTGLDTEKCHVIEVGAALWDTERRAPIALICELVSLPEGTRLPSEIEELTGIREEDLVAFGRSESFVFKRLLDLVFHAEYVVAQNGTDFDELIFDRVAAQHAHESDRALSRPWIDLSVDVPYPERITTRKLTHLCAEHGFLNPFSHRAVFDVLSMLKVLDAYPIDQIIDLAKSPTLRTQALVSYEDREKAKARGYRWDGATKTWTKNIKECHLAREEAEAGFPIRVLKSANQ